MSDFCVAPWTNMHLHPSGYVKPCCIFVGDIGDAHQDVKLENAYFSAKAQEIRSQFLRGERPKGCQKCFDKEAAGATSHRNDQNRRILEHGRDKVSSPESLTDVISLDISFSNACNMSCKFCGPFCSTKWITEAKRLPSSEDGFWSDYKWSWKPFHTKAKDLLETVSHFPRLQILEIKGGEPFLHPEHMTFLKGLIESGMAKNLSLYYVTNGSILPAQFLELAPHFKRIAMTLSIDGVGETYSYIRGFPKGEDMIGKAIEFFGGLSNVELNLNFTLCALNIFNISDFMEWVETRRERHDLPVSLGMVVNPRLLNPLILPKWFREQARDRLQKWVKDPFVSRVDEILSRDSSGNDLSEFWRFVDEIDRLQNTSIAESLPEFSQLRSLSS